MFATPIPIFNRRAFQQVLYHRTAAKLWIVLGLLFFCVLPATAGFMTSSPPVNNSSALKSLIFITPSSAFYEAFGLWKTAYVAPGSTSGRSSLLHGSMLKIFGAERRRLSGERSTPGLTSLPSLALA